MAGDWIKMRVDLATDPAVIAIADQTGLDEDAVVGKLYRVWTWADTHTTDGHLRCGPAVVNRIARHDGFSEAMHAAGWLVIEDGVVILPRFERHNGSTAKARAQAAQRSARKRKRDESVTPALRERDASVTKCAPREEKRREEKTTPKASSSAAAADFERLGFDKQAAKRLARHPNASAEYAQAAIHRALNDPSIADPRRWVAAAIERGGFDTTIPPPRAEPERWSATPDEAAEWARTAGEAPA